MSNWKKRKDTFIPDMHPPKRYECKVCGSSIIPNKNNRYVVKERLCAGGIGSALGGTYAEAKEFDAFDCMVCGCQMIAKERLKVATDMREGFEF